MHRRVLLDPKMCIFTDMHVCSQRAGVHFKPHPHTRTVNMDPFYVFEINNSSTGLGSDSTNSGECNQKHEMYRCFRVYIRPGAYNELCTQHVLRPLKGKTLSTVQGESVEEIYLIIIGTPEWEGYELSHSGGITKEQLNAAYTELTRKLSTYLHKIYRWDSFLGAEPEHRPGLRLFAHPN